MRLDVVKNSLSNMGAFAVSLGVGILYTPYLVRQLGVELYGIVPLVTSLLTWLGLLTLALNWSLGRYLIMADQKEQGKEANRIFNTAFFLAIAAAPLIVGLGIIASPAIVQIIRIPANHVDDVSLLVTLMMLTFAVSIVTAVFEVGTFCRNRYDIRSVLQALRSLSTVFGVVALFTWTRPSVAGIGWVSVAVAGLMLASTFLVFRRLMPKIQFSLKWFAPSWISRMLGTNAWVVLDQAGVLLLWKIDLLLANRFFGPAIAGEYALALQWAIMLKAVMSACNVFAPTYTRYVASGDTEALRNYALRACRFTGKIMALFIGLVLGFGGDLLTVWLGREITNGSLLMACMLVPLTMNSAINPLYGVWHAHCKVRTPCFATLFAGFLAVAIAVGLVLGLGYGVWAVAIAGSLAFTLRNLVFTIPYASRLMESSPLPFYRESLIATVTALLVAGACTLLRQWIPATSWPAIVLTGTLVSVGYVLTSISYWRNIIREVRLQAHSDVEMEPDVV